MNFISFRRYYLDQELDNNNHLFKGVVLDVGGKKKNKRGKFTPPYKQVDKWLFLNNDKTTNPDIFADLPNIPLEDESIDIVVCTEVIEYVYDYQKTLSEINRILKKNGILILSLPFLHTLHADDDYDCFRLTEPLIKKELSINKFNICSFKRMGGVCAVIFDLIRGYLSYQTKHTFYIRFLTRIWMSLSIVFKIMDKICCKNNYYINTGYFIIGTKNENF